MNSVSRLSFRLLISLFLLPVLTAHAQDWFKTRTVGGVTQPRLVSLDGRLAPSEGVEQPDSATTTLQFNSTTFAATNLPISIPDNNTTGISSAIQVNLSGATRLLITLNITHTAIQDLTLDLVAPNGTRFSLYNRGLSGANLTATDFALTLPAGTPINGTWTLVVRDVDRLDTGRLNSWSLTAQAPGAALIDLVISLASNPTGDNNGNSQGGVNSDAQNRWERIIGHFADGVYEATEGAHRIRTVRVYRKARNWSTADITWDNATPDATHPNHPHAYGINQIGGRVFMYELFGNGDGRGNNVDLVNNERAGGFTMTHEWGHYFYGIYDEYAKDATELSVSPSLMSSQWNAIASNGGEGDLRWLNFSIKGPAQASGPFGVFQNTFRTKQHKAYGASAWEVLSRPASSDPTDSTSLSYRSLGARSYYPELSLVAPTGAPRIDLPSAAARASLNIIWMSDRLTTEIVIDQSGSMLDENKIASARAAAKFLVDVADLGSTRIGVTSFDTVVRNVIAQRDINTQADKDAIKAAIDTIVAGGSTAIGDAAAAALTKITSGSTATGDSRVVFLLTDGQNTDGRDPLSVIPSYNAAQIPLFTFGFGSDADGSTLGAMARQTGGQYYYAPSSLAEISSAFRAASLLTGSNPGIQSDTVLVLSGTTATTSFATDPGLSRLQLNVAYNSAPSGAQVQLISPSGAIISPISTNVSGTETISLFDIDRPATGSWRLNTTAVGGGRTFRYDASGVNAAVGYNVVASAGGAPATYPAPAIITAQLSRNLPIARATALATITDASGNVTQLPLRDDGRSPDVVANDGIYTLPFYYPHTGDYSVRIDFSNPTGSAVQTHNGGAASATLTGTDLPQPPDLPITEAFTRSQTISLSVTGTRGFTSRLVNLSILSTIKTPGDSFSLGYVTGGAGTSGTKPLVIRAAGPSLAQYGVPALLADPKIELYAGSTKVSENDNWGGSTAIAQAMASVGAFGFTDATSKDAATVTNITTRDNSIKVSGVGNATGTVLAEIYDATPEATFTPTTPRLINISVLKSISAGETLTTGFVITGSAAKTVLIRAVGPTLGTSFGIAGSMTDPKVDLYSGSSVIASSDNWGGGGVLSQAFSKVGAFSLGAATKDAALVITLQAGSYTAQVTGVNGASGVTLVEVYEMP
jgi:uncharacterized protein YegL